MSHYRAHCTLCKTSTCKRLDFKVNILSFCTILCILNSELPAPHPGSCWAIKVQSIIFGLVLTHQHTHDQHYVCVHVRRGFHPCDMEGLASPEHNNGCIEEDIAPRGLAWMECYGGVWGDGGDVFWSRGLLCTETLSPAAVAWHAPVSGRTDNSHQCQVSWCGRWRGPLSS